MSKKKQKSYALEITLVVLAVLLAFFVQGVIKYANPPEVSIAPGDKTAVGESGAEGEGRSSGEVSKVEMPKYNPFLTDLGAEPDWAKLEEYQYTISKDDFERELDEVYTIDGEWMQWVSTSEKSAIIQTSAADPTRFFELFFSSEVKQEKPPKFWRERDELTIKDVKKPLFGIRIVIDPGHIGGDFAEIEERDFVHNELPPVREGDLTLKVAKLLTQQLEILGAEVKLTREYLKPVNELRAEDYAEFSKEKMEANNMLISPDSVKRMSEKLFYRAGEIKARAELVNTEFRPDLVLCLHFNAGAQSLELLEEEHFHMIPNGAYTSGEVAKDDQRFTMIERILQRIHPEEARLAAYAANVFAAQTGLPPYLYEPDSKRALNVDNNPYLWARNLAANRSYMCPVLFYEPYLMNGKDSHQRILEGDYDGMRYMNGMLRPSIFREYVNSVTEGLVNYYSKRK